MVSKVEFQKMLNGKAAGDTTVTLSPIETGLDGGKKIAVVAPSFSSETRFLDEYFLVEFDSGQGNNKVAFEQNATEPGFRIFHVNAAAEYNENTGTVYIYNKRKSSPAPESLKSCYQAADRAAEKGYTYLAVSYGCLNKSFCTYADQKGVELYGSTTNTYAKLQSMVLDYNIRIMFSDWRLFQ